MAVTEFIFWTRPVGSYGGTKILVMYPSSNRVWACAADPHLWGVDSGIGSETGAAEGGMVGGAVSMVV